MDYIIYDRVHGDPTIAEAVFMQDRKCSTADNQAVRRILGGREEEPRSREPRQRAAGAAGKDNGFLSFAVQYRGGLDRPAHSQIRTNG